MPQKSGSFRSQYSPGDSCTTDYWFQCYCRPRPAPSQELCGSFMLTAFRDSFFTGCVLMATIVQIPQRLTTVNGSSPLAAGTRMLPFAALIPAGSTIGAIMMGRMKIPPFYLVMLSVVLEIAGVVGLSQASTSFHIHPSQYGFQILVGLGCGISNVALGMLVPYVVDNKDLGKLKRFNRFLSTPLKGIRMTLTDERFQPLELAPTPNSVCSAEWSASRSSRASRRGQSDTSCWV